MNGDAPTDRVLTVPNLLSVGRLLCVPLFLWLLFGRDSEVGAALLLAGLGATDWVDGFVARRFGQVSEVGKVLDPTADRVLLATAAIAMWVSGAVPGVVFWPVIAREIAISAVVVWLAAVGARRIDVLWVGKAGAFGLMFAFPFFLMGEGVHGTAADVWRFLAWGCAIPGVFFSYYAAVQYTRLVPGALADRGLAASQGVTP